MILSLNTKHLTGVKGEFNPPKLFRLGPGFEDTDQITFAPLTVVFYKIHTNNLSSHLPY